MRGFSVQGNEEEVQVLRHSGEQFQFTEDFTPTTSSKDSETDFRDWLKAGV